MQQVRIWTLGFVVLALAILAGGWFLGVSPKLDEARAASESLTQTQQQNQVQESLLASLAQQAEDLPTLEAQLAELQRSVPPTPDLETLANEIDDAARASGATVAAIDLGVPTPYAPASADLSVGSLSATNFWTMTVHVNATGSLSDVLDLVDRLQTGDRLLLVTSLSITDSDGLVADINGLAYVLADPRVTELNPLAIPTDPAAEAPAEGDDAAAEDG